MYVNEFNIDLSLVHLAHRHTLDVENFTDM